MTVLYVGEEEVSKEEMEKIEFFCMKKDIPPSEYLRESWIRMWYASRHFIKYG
jgi:hypothetical protein